MCLKINGHSLAIWARVSTLLVDEELVMNLQIFSPLIDDNQESGLSTCYSNCKLLFESLLKNISS
jgi:hypothetical protein